METARPIVDTQAAPHLERRIGLVQATSLNMINMVGAGPFFTIPFLMTAMGGPQALLGWAVAALVCIPDGMVWAELGAAMPGSGGSYVYLREAYGPRTWGRFMAFLFIWQFVLSGPLELASGYIPFGRYLSYLWHGMLPWQMKLVAALAGAVNVVVLFRRITSIGKLSIALWIGMLVTVAWVIVAGASRFDARVAFDFPPGAFQFSSRFLLTVGAAAHFGIYDYLGYYNICYVGDEVRNPGRVIPRSIILSLMVVALIYLLMNLAIIGTVPWREFVPASESNPVSRHLVSVLVERVCGSRWAVFFTLLILLTIYGAAFATLLGYSRIAYAAAQDGNFFAIFGRLHRKLHFPHVSLVIIGAISVLACFLSLQMVIDGIIASRVLIQFIGQVFAVVLLRRRCPEMPRPYRMWLYPLPCLLAFLGWVFVFVTFDKSIIVFSLAVLVLGICAFLVWTRMTRRWPWPQPATERIEDAGRQWTDSSL